MANKELTFAAFGRGIKFAVDGDEIVLRIPNKRDGALPSASGKTLIAAQTEGGWATIPGTEVRMNLQAGFRAKA